LATTKGWIKLHRQITDSEFWLSERFTRSQAWVDILLLASHAARTLFIRGIEINLEPGELCYSQLSLAERWGWNRKTVMAFLNLLSRREMILIKADKRFSHLTTVISIRNWFEYQADGQPSGQRNGQRRDSGTDTNKNGETKENVEKKEGAFPGVHQPEEAQEIDEIVATWNEFAGAHELSRVSKVTAQRKKGILARLRDSDFEMMKLIQAIEAQPFLFGENGRGWRADFDWIFLHEENYIKIMEGKYGKADRSETHLGSGTGGSQYARATFRHTEADIQRLRNFEATLAERDRERSERS
jgi:hypothetical protein